MFGQFHRALARTVAGASMIELVSDCKGFDVVALGQSRQRVADVVREPRRVAFGPVRHRRILEIGTDFGRLTRTLTGLVAEVICSDFDSGSLGRLDFPDGAEGPTMRIAPNVFHLPFVDGAFTGVSMVRVHHHLADPLAVMRELCWVLQGGDRLAVSYNPKPTIGTLVDDVQRATRRSGATPFQSITFSRSG